MSHPAPKLGDPTAGAPKQLESKTLSQSGCLSKAEVRGRWDRVWERNKQAFVPLLAQCNGGLLFYLFNWVKISISLTEKASARVLRGSRSL